MMVTSLILLRHSTSSISICESVTSSLSPKRLLSHYPGSQPLVPANHILLQWITPHAESAYAQLQQYLPISLRKVVLSRLLNSITKDTRTQYGGCQTQFRIGWTDFNSGTYSTMLNGRCHHITFQTLHQYLDSANQCMWLYGQSLWLHSAYAVNLVELIPKYGDWVYHFSLLGQRVSVSKGSNFLYDCLSCWLSHEHHPGGFVITSLLFVAWQWVSLLALCSGWCFSCTSSLRRSQHLNLLRFNDHEFNGNQTCHSIKTRWFLTDTLL